MTEATGLAKVDSKFFKSDFYKKVKKRKNALRKKLLKHDVTSWPEILPLTRVSVECDFNDLTDALKKVRAGDHTDCRFDPFSPRLQMVTKKGKQDCDFICIEYFRLYHVSEDRTRIHRYSYIECYYDEYVLACIVDSTALKKAGSFPPLSMDQSDWAVAQQQMRLWNQYLLPEIEELPVKQYTYSPELCERAKYYVKCYQRQSDETYEYPKVDDPSWILITYLHLLQMLPLLPKKSVPIYYLNFVCEKQENREVLAEKMRAFLSEYFRKDPIIRGSILITEKLLSKEMDKGSDYAWPYIFQVKKPKDLELLQNAMNHHAMADKIRKDHPLKNYVPICINDRYVADSTALNIPVVDVEKISWNIEVLGGMKEKLGQILDMCLKKIPKSQIRQILKQNKKAVLTKAGQLCDGKDLWQELLKYDSKWIDLATWFVLLRRDHDGSNAEECFKKFLEELTVKRQSVDGIVDIVMKRLKTEYDSLEDLRPLYTGSDTPEERKFRDTISGQKLLCINPVDFEQVLQEYAPTTEPAELLHRMKALGHLKTKSSDCLRYGVNLKSADGGKRKSIDYYAIIME